MLLKLRGESEHQAFDEALPEPVDQLTSDEMLEADVPEIVEEGDAEDAEERDGLQLLLRGLVIATASFVPTFLAVFLGLPYLLGPATDPPTPSLPVPAAVGPLRADLSEGMAPALPETIHDPAVGREPLDPSATPSPAPSAGAGASEAPSSARESIVRAPARSESAPSMREPARGGRSPSPATRAEPRGLGPGWARAAAFPDREAASRLASSIQAQGYPAEIRQDRASTRPWVVWIGAEPRGGGRGR